MQDLSGRPRERSNPMKWQWSVLVLALLTCSALAQETPPGTAIPPDPTFTPVDSPSYSPVFSSGLADPRGDRLSGNHSFVNFINWMSNPLQAVKDALGCHGLYSTRGSSTG